MTPVRRPPAPGGTVARPASLRIEEHRPLAPLTTLGVGGPARYFARPASLGELRGLLDWARRQALSVFVLGGGSNVLISDAGYDGLVIQPALRGVTWTAEGTAVRVSVAAGETWDDLVAQSVARDCSGLECLSGIPGWAGAAPIQNIGAYGQEVADRLIGVSALDITTLDEVEIDRNACDFGYRSSVFKTTEPGGRLVILRVELELNAGPPAGVRHDELGRRLGLRPCSAAEIRDVVLDLRRAKSMVLDPKDPLTRSVGSFFMNPFLSAQERRAAEEHGRARGLLAEDEVLTAFVLGDGRVKVPAAWLIERAGFPRGLRRGRVGISDRHALAIVNCGGATAADVASLAREIRDGVERGFGVRLTPEPVLLGALID
jgi:UDP-N-acetylmuramate dehydrogenase